jgi:acid phosphatase type 7
MRKRFTNLSLGVAVLTAAWLVPASPAAALFATSTGLSASPNPSCTNRSVAMQAGVSSSNPVDPTPAGTVNFSDGGSVLATVALDGNGTARFSTSALGPGTHQLRASYSGDALNDPSASGSFAQQVTSCGPGGGGGAGGAGGGSAAQKPPQPPKLIAAAGDIACGPANPNYNGGAGTAGACQQRATANLLGSRPLDGILPLGDLQYDNPSLGGFLSSYDPTWGRWRQISHPIVGNHEYDDQLGAQGYWDYWNGAGKKKGPAGVRGRGWYSFDVGSWHMVALNSNCDIVSCRRHSRQMKWLRRDLRKHKGHCVLAYMHHPKFSSGLYEEHQSTGAIWKVLFRRGADVILTGHDHIYERFAPMGPSGRLRGRRGITEFTVGTGGYVPFSIASPRSANSRFASASFGVLFMRLAQKTFHWSFVDVGGATLDEGDQACHPAWPRRHHHHGKHTHHHGKHGHRPVG